MGLARTRAPHGQVGRTSAKRRPSSDTQWRLLSLADGLRLAVCATRIRSVVHRLPLLLLLAPSWRRAGAELAPSWRRAGVELAPSWRRAGAWERIHRVLRERVRRADGREPTPSAAIIDSQSVKTTEQGGPHGYDGGKKVNGRKRHILVDTLGLLLKVVVHPANLQDREGAKLVLAGLQRRFPRLRHLWADQAYTGPILDWIKEQMGWTLEVVERSPRRGFVVTADGEFQRVALPKIFEPLPRRWVVERTLAWTSRYRRLSKDYERLPATSEALVYLTSIRLLLGRLTRDQK
jgi:putative transposase